MSRFYKTTEHCSAVDMWVKEYLYLLCLTAKHNIFI